MHHKDKVVILMEDMDNNSSNNSQLMVVNRVMGNKWEIHINKLKVVTDNSNMVVHNKVMEVVMVIRISNSNHIILMEWAIQVRWDSLVKNKCHIMEMLLNHNHMGLLDRKIQLKM